MPVGGVHASNRTIGIAHGPLSAAPTLFGRGGPQVVLLRVVGLARGVRPDYQATTVGSVALAATPCRAEPLGPVEKVLVSRESLHEFTERVDEHSDGVARPRHGRE